jgi:hypothetical protein
LPKVVVAASAVGIIAVVAIAAAHSAANGLSNAREQNRFFIVFAPWTMVFSTATRRGTW